MSRAVALLTLTLFLGIELLGFPRFATAQSHNIVDDSRVIDLNNVCHPEEADRTTAAHWKASPSFTTTLILRLLMR